LRRLISLVSIFGNQVYSVAQDERPSIPHTRLGLNPFGNQVYSVDYYAEEK
jgi:hypothetical protein